MITTVTTSTVSTATATAISGSLAFVGIVLLITLLVQKEFFSGSDKKQAIRNIKVLNIAIPPMLITFALIVLSKIGQTLNQ